ncbi:hypothetical protein ANCCAN_20175 [Ancylostoma caninum]|uniref:Uncharacterized protein n=1 Tax=Ancylostoma caninum TaxID=29170 RepID=A0A368FP87_ANCCA|nr:hypothetical protein ANCCAN_20175 [Ancylostoma caninum]
MTSFSFRFLQMEALFGEKIANLLSALPLTSKPSLFWFVYQTVLRICKQTFKFGSEEEKKYFGGHFKWGVIEFIEDVQQARSLSSSCGSSDVEDVLRFCLRYPARSV